MHTVCGHTYNQHEMPLAAQGTSFLFFKLILGEFHTHVQSYF